MSKNKIPKKVIYYFDDLNDDFAQNNIITKKLSDNYKYIHKNPIWLCVEFFLYELIARPLVTVFTKLFYCQKFIGKEKLKEARKSGYFVYINHTNALLDSFCPTMLTYPKKDFIICHPDALSIPCIKNIVTMFGAIPTFTSLKGYKKFSNAIEQRIKEKQTIIIYPEAHIWPYYTDIRPFKDISMEYPVQLNAPCFTMTNIYEKRKCKFIKRPKVTSYINGPFYPDKAIDARKARMKLRDEIYSSMKNEVESHPKYEYFKYVKND